MVSVEFAIIGGGLAGLTAANRLAGTGRSVVVFEKGEDAHYMCNTRISGGALHASYREPRAPKETIRDAVRNATAGTASEALVEAIAQDLPVLLDWLRAEGVRFVKVGAEEYHRWVMAPPRPNRGGLYWKGLAGDVLLQTLEASLMRRGARVERGRRITGIARTPSGFDLNVDHEGQKETVAAKAVFICDGGFQANPELVGRYISPQPDRLFQRNSGTGCGDGLRMAVSLGAATTGLERFYGHLLSRDVFSNNRLWPWPQIDPLATAGIIVNAEGYRFLDETEGGVIASNLLARLPDPLSATAIFDAEAWNVAGRRGIVPPNPILEQSGARIEVAGTIAELAAKLDIPAEALERTVCEVNAATEAGTGGKLTPPRRGAQHAVRVAPFRGIPLAAGITYTMGGIAIDGDGRVLDNDGQVISGLYAAGSATGGLEGGPRAGYVGGLAKAGVTALRASGHAIHAIA